MHLRKLTGLVLVGLGLGAAALAAPARATLADAAEQQDKTSIRTLLKTGVDVTTRLNGEVKQRGNTREFIFSIPEVIRYISQVMTLEPGDLISTGTPAGVGPMSAGDVVEVEVSGIGTLRNRVS